MDLSFVLPSTSAPDQVLLDHTQEYKPLADKASNLFSFGSLSDYLIYSDFQVLFETMCQEKQSKPFLFTAFFLVIAAFYHFSKDK